MSVSTFACNVHVDARSISDEVVPITRYMVSVHSSVSVMTIAREMANALVASVRLEHRGRSEIYAAKVEKPALVV